MFLKKNKSHSKIFNINNSHSFEESAIEIFNYQARHSEVYKEYIEGLSVPPEQIKEIKQIPFLPIELFKTHKITAGGVSAQKVFKSSGTGHSGSSSHYVANILLYEESFSKGFELFFGNVNQYCILALLPSYLEQENSSLIYMVNDLIKKSNHPSSAFYMNNIDELVIKLVELDKKNQKTILIGVTYALLDFVEKHKLNLKNTIVMETGGMKGRRKEMVREEVHEILRKGFGVNTIHSEYGMTELLSQAYSKGQGLFYTPPWMKVLIRDVEDPMHYVDSDKTGGINIIDLANIYSCSFIATQDLGKMYSGGSFEVIGRFDNSDVRGCNLMIN